MDEGGHVVWVGEDDTLSLASIVTWMDDFA